jgi:methylmalonyl-CoA/ethylmalonyl-CoA epimerase
MNIPNNINRMLKEAKFHHIGIAVLSIDAIKPFYTAMGYEVSDTVIEPVQLVKVAYARKGGCPVMELLEPLNEKSPVQNILKRMGNTPYHVCFEVPNLSDAIKEARAWGFLPLAKPVPGRGLDNAMMLFLYNKNVGLIQIMEK